MSNRSDEAKDPPAATCDELMEDALDAVFAPLVDLVPIAERRAMRAEMQSHIRALAQEQAGGKEDPVAAMRAALSRFGEPQRIAREVVRARTGPLRRAFGPGSLLAAGLVGALIGSDAILVLLWLAHIAPSSNGVEALTGAAFGLLVGLAAQRWRTSPQRTAFGAAITAGGALCAAFTCAILIHPHQMPPDKMRELAWAVITYSAAVAAAGAVAGAVIANACSALRQLDQRCDIDSRRDQTA